jgi:hypothetical protein
MICVMHQADPYGHLVINGHPILPQTLARMVGAKLGEVIRWLNELENAGVCNKEGETYISRRMVRDEALRKVRAEGGKLGGNPALMDKAKVPSKVNLPANLQPTPSSSTSSSTSKPTTSPSAQFLSFWASWPSNDRKEAKGKCFELWRKKNLDAHVDEILAHVERMKRSEGWRNGYVPAPKVYLNESRWEGAEIPRSNEEVL